MNFRKKIVVMFLFFFIVFGSFYVQPAKSAIAAGFAGVVSVDIPRTIAWIKTVIVRTLARKMLTMFSNKLISKIRGSGRDGGPAFVRNWRNFITEGQYRGEDIFKTVLASTPVCNYLDKSIKDAFRIDGSQKIPFRGNNVRVSNLDPFNLRAACTLPFGFDMAAYRRDFAGNGGWDAWSRLMEPQNNYYGLLFEALDELEKQRDLSQTANLAEPTSGSGYTSIRDGCGDLPPIDTTNYTCGGESSGTCPAGQQCQTTDGQHYKCDGTPVATPPPSNARCTFMGKVFTPADLLGKSAAATIDAEMGWLISSQQIADIAVGILNAVIDRLGNLAESALIDENGDGSNDSDISPNRSYREEFCTARGPSTEAFNFIKENYPDAYEQFPPTLDNEKDGPIGGKWILASYCSTLQDNFNPYPTQRCTINCLRAVGAGAPPLDPSPSGLPSSLEMAVCQNTKSNLTDNAKPELFVSAFGPSCTLSPEGDPLGPYFCPTAKKVLTQGVSKTDRQAMQKICRVSFCAHTQLQSQWWGWMDGGRNAYPFEFSSATVGDFCSKNLSWFGFDNPRNLPTDATSCSALNPLANGYIGGGATESFTATADDPLAKCASQIVAPQP